jgi:DNA-binding transcriptional ArsR family regulator
MAKWRNEGAVRDATEVARALGDRNRVRILRALRARELCVCQIAELLGLAPSTISKHMTILRQAGLVDFRKNGRWAFYSRTAFAPAPAAALAWLDAAVEEDPALREDAVRLRRILEQSPEELCRRVGTR